jgi:hypothetical protein
MKEAANQDGRRLIHVNGGARRRDIQNTCLIGNPSPRHPDKAIGKEAKVSLMLFILRLIAFTLLFASMSRASGAPAFEVEAICRTAIASLMDRDPKSMQVTLATGDVLLLSYVRPIDNFVWTYRCRVEGNRVVWANEPGRWRDGPKDEKIFFEVVDGGKQLRIIEDHGDGSRTNQLFDRDTIL